MEGAFGFFTSDGMIYYFMPPSSGGGLEIAVDTNGVKGPNQAGRDLQRFSYCNGKLSFATYCGGSLKFSPLYHIVQDGWKMNY